MQKKLFAMHRAVAFSLIAAMSILTFESGHITGRAQSDQSKAAANATFTTDASSNGNSAGLGITASAHGQTIKPCFDFFGSGRTSFATVGSVGNNRFWSLLNNGGAGEQELVAYGLLTDFLTPGYFDADNRADLNIWRLGNAADTQARYFIRPSTAPSTTLVVNWGRANITPGGANNDVAGNEGDYDGDGRDDATILRLQGNNYVWFYLRSSSNTVGVVTFGNAITDTPLPGADYTGDGRADLGVLRSGPGADTYIIGDSNTGAIVLAEQWGDFATDYYVTGNYLGDSRADFAVWRGFGSASDGIWYIRENGGTATLALRWGIPGTAGADTAVCGDYDGDGRSDVAVYRSSNSTFYWINSASLGGTATVGTQTWGQPGDLAIGSLKVR